MKTSFHGICGKWKVKLLSDECFIQYVKEAMDEMKSEQMPSVGAQWGLFKQQLKMKAIQRSSFLKYEEKVKERNLRAMLEKLVKLECR